MTPDALIDRLATLLPDARPGPRDAARGEAVIVVEPEKVADVLRTLREHPELGFDQLSDLTAVDYLGRIPRFEVVFLYPWAIVFRPLGLFGFVEMAIFVLVLALGFVYVWRKGALEWA